MTSLIDEGLVESCLDDTIPVIDLDQVAVIDVDKIDATIEDPGYILDEDLDDLDDVFNRNQVKSSDKKRSFALPVTFFDINSNISLLKKCRPISIKIVDCNIYPWYYRKNKNNVKSSSNIYNKDKDLEQCKLMYNSNDLIDLTSCDSLVNDQVDPTPSINLPKINLYPEQRSVVLKLKEDIDNKTYLNEVYDNTIDNTHKKTDPSKKHDDLTIVNSTSIDGNVPECSSNNSIEFHDLIKYKEIAQTIVRNIEHNASSNKTGHMYLKKQNTMIKNTVENNISINAEDSVRDIPEQINEERTKITTSPILPYTIKRPKKTKSIEKMLPLPQKANGNMKRCIDSNKNCHKLMSLVNHIIPHYHCYQSIEASYNKNNLITNQMHFQEPISKVSPLHCHPYFHKNDILPGNNGLFTNYSSDSRLVTKSLNVSEVSYLDSSKEVFNSGEIRKDQLNSQNTNSLRYIRRSVKQLCNDKYGILSQTSIPRNNCYYNDISNSTCSQNNNVNYNSMRISVQPQVSNVNSTIQRNPILSQILNTNDISTKYSQPVQFHSGLDPKTVVTSTPYSTRDQNIRIQPGPLLPGYEPFYSTTQYTQHENFQCSNAGTPLQDFQNMENTNFFQDKINYGLKKLASTPNNPRNYNNLKWVQIDPAKVTVSTSSRVDPVKQNDYPQTEMQSISKASSVFCRNNNQKTLINTNSKINQQSLLKVSVKPNISKDVKTDKKYNLNAIINVLSNHKSDCVSSKVHKSYAQEKNKQEHVIFEVNQLDTKSKVAGDPKTYTIVHLSKLKDNSTPEKVEFKTNGYSPPILPIPTFKKSLEMLSGIQHSQKLTGNNYSEPHANKNLLDTCGDRRKKDFTNITRKRKLYIDDKLYGNCKRISLQEYKLRRSENVNNI